MAKYLVMKKNASAFASGEGSFLVVDGQVELPEGALAADLLAEGIIKPMPVKPSEPVLPVSTAKSMQEKVKTGAKK